MDSYQSGKVRYPYSSLTPGRHSLTFKVWDVYNNSSEARTEFIVAETAALALEHVLNYPNPFTTHTTFMFEHNRPYQQLSAQVQIFTVSGKLVKTLDKIVTTEGYRSDDIEWDGLDDYGDRIGRGVYVYKLKVKDFNGSSSEKFEKLVILR
jgi:flagellar hook assembly protein FlgD